MPKGDEMKLNNDGNFESTDHIDGWGFVVRNSVGDVLGARASSMHYAYDVLQTEASACLAGLQWANEWGYQYN
jgi:ribonuclease HI